jgi:DMSO/TMAO reductase YedYZ molybdopterin-dependent catalytic subunit
VDAMPRRLTNDLLLMVILAQVLGGVLGWVLPVEMARPLYDVHRALGVALLLLLGWKAAIVLASLRRRLRRSNGWDRSILWGSAAGVALLSAVALGLAWTLHLISFDWLWGYSPLNVHVFLGVGLVPFVGWHMLLRRRQNGVSAPLRSRRTLLRVTGLSLGTLVGWQAVEHLAPAIRLPTGSKPVGSFNADAFPAEIWLFDSVPSLELATWRLSVLGREFSFDDLIAQHPRAEVQSVLDCTSGWWSEQIWSGVRLMDVLQSAGVTSSATDVAAVSVTGHRIVLPLSALGEAVLASHVGGEPLSPGHGYPLRLIVPGYRGYHWVKWLSSLEPA